MDRVITVLDCYIYHPKEMVVPVRGMHFNSLWPVTGLSENVCILIHIALKFVPKCLINNMLALVQIMAWCGAELVTSHYL